MNKQKGFSLIELMIVVAIIGILAAITIPAYQTYVQKAANSACLAEAKGTISVAIADKASDGVILNSYVPIACTVPAATADALKKDQKLDGIADLVFNPLARGASADARNTKCSPLSGTCGLEPIATTTPKP